MAAKTKEAPKTKEVPTIIIAVKYRLYPNKIGKAFLDMHFAASRRYWNWQVERQLENWNTRVERKEQWLAEGNDEKDFPLLDIAQADKDFRKLRNGDDEEFNWIKGTTSRLIGGIYKRQKVAWREGFKKRKQKGFWKGKKKPNKGFPRFRSIIDNQYFDCEANQMKIDWENSRIRLPLCKGEDSTIKFKQHIPHPEGKLGMCVFTRTPTGKYYMFMPVDTGVPMPEKVDFDKSNTVGIDVGIKNYMTLSDSSEIENPRFLEKFNLTFEDGKLSPYKTDPRLVRRKKIRQRRLSKKIFKSQNYRKQKVECSKIDEKIASRRDDFTHELTRVLINMPFNAFAVEDLDIAQMKRKKAPIKGEKGTFKKNGRAQQRGMNRKINDVAWGAFFTRLGYKADHKGKHMIKIDRYEPSSKKCGCGHINDDLKLSDRKWECPECGVVNDRDKLAAMNIKNYVLGGKND